METFQKTHFGKNFIKTKLEKIQIQEIGKNSNKHYLKNSKNDNF